MLDWDARYSSGEYSSTKRPSRLLAGLFYLLPKKGRVLDIACGEGRNALFLAENGYDVDAIDISGVAIERGRLLAAKGGVKINFIQVDLESYKIPAKAYDLIINFNYLQRTLVPKIKKGLKKGGVIIFETFTLEQKTIGPPKNPNYLLKPNELLKLFKDFHILFYREGIFKEGRKKAIASLAAKKP